MVYRMRVKRKARGVGEAKVTGYKRREDGTERLRVLLQGGRLLRAGRPPQRLGEKARTTMSVSFWKVEESDASTMAQKTGRNEMANLTATPRFYNLVFQLAYLRREQRNRFEFPSLRSSRPNNLCLLMARKRGCIMDADRGHHHQEKHFPKRGNLSFEYTILYRSVSTLYNLYARNGGRRI